MVSQTPVGSGLGDEMRCDVKGLAQAGNSVSREMRQIGRDIGDRRKARKSMFARLCQG
ncbi:MAG: hypothetical protein ACJA06_000618 [Halocynthiibacter sp.]|jgi:hypothetical protein